MKPLNPAFEALSSEPSPMVEAVDQTKLESPVLVRRQMIASVIVGALLAAGGMVALSRAEKAAAPSGEETAAVEGMSGNDVDGEMLER